MRAAAAPRQAARKTMGAVTHYSIVVGPYNNPVQDTFAG